MFFIGIDGIMALPYGRGSDGAAADFRLLSREAVRALGQLREYHRFYRGMVEWIGFRSVILPYTPGARLAGRSKILAAQNAAAGGRRHVLLFAGAAAASASG